MPARYKDLASRSSGLAECRPGQRGFAATFDISARSGPCSELPCCTAYSRYRSARSGMLRPPWGRREAFGHRLLKLLRQPVVLPTKVDDAGVEAKESQLGARLQLSNRCLLEHGVQCSNKNVDQVLDRVHRARLRRQHVVVFDGSP